MIPYVSRYHDYQYPFFGSKIKQVAGYLFCIGRNGMRLLMSNHKGKIVSNFTDK